MKASRGRLPNHCPVRARVSLFFLVFVTVASALVGVTPGRAAASVTRTGYVAVRDGTLLKYTVVLPRASGRFPTLMEYSGYEPGTVPDAPYIARFVPQGYAFIGVSLRGTGCSGGVWDFFQPVEAVDGYDVIEWIARQRWSNGRVAMIGKSYPGITQLFVAEQRPPHLVAVAPGHVFADAYRDVPYPGGILNYAFAAGWSFVSQPEPSYDAGLRGLAAGDPICAQNLAARPNNLPHNPFLQAQEHRFDDALFRERSPLETIEQINVPVWTVLSWQDEQVGSRAVHLLERLRAPHHVVLTNGDHSMYRTPPALDELNRFFDHYVKGVRNGFERTPPIRIWWESGRDKKRAPGWVTSLRSWPPKSTARRLPLGAGGTLGEASSGDPDRYLYAGPTGQGIQNARYSGVVTQPDAYLWDVPPPQGAALSYTTPPLTKPLVALGSASADLWLSSTAPDTDVQVTLTEVRPDGQEEFVQVGWLRASHRMLDAAQSRPTRPYQTHQEADSRPLTPLEPALLRVEIFPFGHVFRAGSRIRMWVEGPTLLPQLWGFASLPLPAANAVYHDAAHASALVLPAVDVKVKRGLPPCNTVIRQPCRAA
jgi:putative CocE/NonD family hydrolase